MVITFLEDQTITNIACKKRPAPNAHSETQLRFYLTKKRKVKPHLAKPNSEEMVKCMDDLEEVEVEICGVCFCENDQHNYWM